MFDAELDALPAAAPRDLRLLPGLAWGSVFGRSSLLLPLILLPLVLLFPLVILLADPHMRMNMSETRVASGRVVSVQDADSSRCYQARSQVYAFTVDSGAEYRADTTVCANAPGYARKAGDALPVRYVASDPALNEPGDRSRSELAGLMPALLMPVLLVLVLALVFMPHARAARQARKLFREGRLARASVVFVKRRMMGTNANASALQPFEVYLSYDTPKGRVEGRAHCGNDWLMQHLAPGAGVHVAYLPEKPEEAVMLEAYLR